MYSNKPFTEDQIIGDALFCANDQQWIPAEQVNPAVYFMDGIDRKGLDK